MFRYKASILLIGLLSLLSVLIVLFLSKDISLSYERKSISYYEKYLLDKLMLANDVINANNLLCVNEKTEVVNKQYGNIIYQMFCEKKSIFLDEIPRKKYVYFKHIEKALNLENVPLFKSSSLEDLPDSSIDNPKIIFLETEVYGKLSKDFYGIIITNSEFHLKDGRKLYGVLYSSYPNNANNRYITYNREVIDYFDKHYSNWFFLDNSRNILKNE